MSKIPAPLAKFMERHSIESDEIWQVRPGAFAIKHVAVERAGAKAGVKFDRPAMLEHDSASGIVAMVVFGSLGDRNEWSTGEASPKNSKNSYPYAMAEKRARDRVILKLLTANDDLGAAIYSDEEAEELKQSPQPEDTAIERVDGVQVLTVDAQRPIFSALEREMLNCATVEELKRWKLIAKERASRLSDSWRKVLSDRYLEYLRSLEKREADEYIERMTG